MLKRGAVRFSDIPDNGEHVYRGRGKRAVVISNTKDNFDIRNRFLTIIPRTRTQDSVYSYVKVKSKAFEIAGCEESGVFTCDHIIQLPKRFIDVNEPIGQLPFGQLEKVKNNILDFLSTELPADIEKALGQATYSSRKWERGAIINVSSCIGGTLNSDLAIICSNTVYNIHSRFMCVVFLTKIYEESYELLCNSGELFIGPDLGDNIPEHYLLLPYTVHLINHIDVRFRVSPIVHNGVTTIMDKLRVDRVVSEIGKYLSDN